MAETTHTIEYSRRHIIRLGANVIAGCLLPWLPKAAQAAPFTSQRLTITTRGLRSAQGKDIILIPGLASGPAVWSPLLSRLDGHRLHLVQINGFAKSSAGANATGPLLAPLSDEVARYISSQSIHRPIILGHSMGGILAMMLGLRKSVCASQIIVIDMLPDGSAMVGGTAQGFGYLAGQLNGYLTGTKAGRQILADMVNQTPESRNSDVRVIAQSLTELAQTDLKPQLKRLSSPLTVIAALPGRADIDSTQMRRYRQAYASAPKAKIVGVGPSGHMVMHDQPQKLADVIRKLIE